LRDIPKGAEVTVSYLSDASGTCRDERRAELGFPCACAACSLTNGALAQSNRRRSRIGVLFDLILAAVAEGDGSAIALVGERLKLLREEGMSATWDTLYAAWAYCQSVGDTAGARKWAARAAESAQFGLGRDSSEFQKYTACAR
jgi:hypothetical protein